MITIAQRCSSAKVSVNKTIVSEIKSGLLLLVGVQIRDKQIDIKKTVDKISNLRIFDDEKGKMNLSILDTKGSLLVVSQFTLCGDIKKGRRPSFVNAESPSLSLKIYENLMEDFRQLGIKTLGGVFGEMMDVELVNEGPSNFIIN